MYIKLLFGNLNILLLKCLSKSKHKCIYNCSKSEIYLLNPNNIKKPGIGLKIKPQKKPLNG